MIGRAPSVPPAAGLTGWAAFVLIGWSGVLVPALIRQVREDYGQTDAGIGVYYLLFAAAWAAGSLAGGLATERLGRRVVLVAAAALMTAGFVALGTAPTWALFLAAAVPSGLGSGGIDGGLNGLFLDLFRTRRARALNLLHVFFSLGALVAPVIVGSLVEAGLRWNAVIVGTGIAAAPIAVLFAVLPMPDGRRDGTRQDRSAAAGDDVDRGPLVAAPEIAGAPVLPAAPPSRPARGIPAPLLLLAFAIAAYVASEAGVSNWLVRFLEPAPLSVATTTLSLLWAGLTLGRVFAVRYADRFDHGSFALVSVMAMAVALAGAIVAPSLPLAIALFAVFGFASGPVFPMIIALGGERYPARSAAVSGFLASAAVSGAIIYPPVMGFMSVTVGLGWAMAGNVLLAAAAAVALLLVRGERGRPRG